MEESLHLKNGLVKINPDVGAAFDPDKHEAMSMVKDESKGSNTVLQVLQAGYELNGRVLRAAMVMVVQ